MSLEEFEFAKQRVSKQKKIEYPVSEFDIWKGVNPRNTMIVYLTPDQYLHLAATLATPDKQAIEEYKDRIENRKDTPIPTLWLEESKFCGLGVVTGHEGRHRALASKELGIQQIPVKLIFVGESLYKDERNPTNPNLVTIKLRRFNQLPQDEFYKELLELQKTANRLPNYCSATAEGNLSCILEPENRKELFVK